MNNSAWSLWFWVITPLISGYVVAKLAVKIPLMHGLFTSFCSLLVVTALAHPNGVGAWFAIVIMNISFSIFGAWLWRRYSQKGNMTSNPTFERDCAKARSPSTSR
jgi:hypothetical protein